MSIQSTTTITREEAINRAINKRIDKNRQKELLAKFTMMSDTELEDYLESTFDNYTIRD